MENTPSSRLRLRFKLCSKKRDAFRVKHRNRVERTREIFKRGQNNPRPLRIYGSIQFRKKRKVRKVLSLGYENPLKVPLELYFTVHVN